MDTPASHQATGSSTIYENCDCMGSSLLWSTGLDPIEAIPRSIGLSGSKRRRTGLPSCRIGSAGRWHSLRAYFLNFG